MKKGQKKRTWTPEEKAEIVNKHLAEHVSVRTLEKEYHADRSMICRWVKKYIVEGESSFVHKGHPGNHFAALHTSKHLSEEDRLRLMVAKLEIERVLSTLHGLFPRPMSIITYFAPCREWQLLQIIPLLKPSTAG